MHEGTRVTEAPSDRLLSIDLYLKQLTATGSAKVVYLVRH